MPPSASALPDLAGLYAHHHGWLRSWLFGRLGCSSDAADLAQDVFVRLILRPAPRGFASPWQARAYLRTVARGLCIDLWHRREIERAWLQSLAALPETQAPSAEHQAMVLQALNEIGAMLLTLPSKAARAFLLAEACQMTDREVAVELGVSERMVRKYLAQAMTRCLQLRARETAVELIDAR